MSVAHWSAPFFSCAPKVAFGPVIGPPTPTFTWAEAGAASAIAAPSAMPANRSFFMKFPLMVVW